MSKRGRPMGGFFSFLLRFIAIAAGALALCVSPSPGWVEARYANSGYPVWEHAIFPLTNALPWSLGDIAALTGLAWIAASLAIVVRRRRVAVWQKAALVALDVLAIGGVYALWFEASWGWNYVRAPIEARTAYEPSRVNPDAVNALRRVAIARINALAAAAHRGAGAPL